MATSAPSRRVSARLASLLAMSMLPQEFLLILTVFMAMGAWRLSRQQVLTRRTVRRYAGRQPEPALLDMLTAAALSASSKSDFQQASILRVMDPAIRAAIGALFPAMPWIGAAPVFYVFLGDARRLQRIGELRGKPVENGTLEGFFNAAVDAALALQTFILAAESAGLGCCPISVIRNRIDAIAPLEKAGKNTDA